MSRVLRRPAADRDLIKIYRYLARERGLRTADHFFFQAEATFLRLAGVPGLGARYDSDAPLDVDVRFAPISKHRSYLVFYRPRPNGIEVLRVLHGARDINSILTDEPLG